MKEIWKNIEGYEGYEVSNLGRVKSLNYNHTGTERVLKSRIDRYGYLYVDLCKDGKRKCYKVHRLVAQAFIPNPLSLPEVNHLDENPLNNKVSNLEWSDREHNNNYGTRNIRAAKSRSKPVLQLTLDGKLVREWPSGIEAQRQGGFNNSAISNCCSGRYKKHGGYRWAYKAAANW